PPVQQLHSRRFQKSVTKAIVIRCPIQPSASSRIGYCNTSTTCVMVVLLMNLGGTLSWIDPRVGIRNHSGNIPRCKPGCGLIFTEPRELAFGVPAGMLLDFIHGVRQCTLAIQVIE